MRIFLKNTDGKPSASLTMMIVGFLIVTCWLLFWVGGRAFGLPVPEFDATSAMAYLTPLLGLYFGRRYTSTTDATNKTREVSLGEQVTTTPQEENEESQ